MNSHKFYYLVFQSFLELILNILSRLSNDNPHPGYQAMYPFIAMGYRNCRGYFSVSVAMVTLTLHLPHLWFAKFHQLRGFLRFKSSNEDRNKFVLLTAIDTPLSL
jgi:hypothetical protein